MRQGPILAAVGIAAAVVGAAGVAFAANRRSSGSLMPAGPLSARRKAVLAALDEVVPSKYPEAKFMAIVGPRYDPDDPALPPGFTTCGALPCYIGQILKVARPYCITQGGLEQMRINGRAIGAWIEPNGHNRPQPGDLYGQGGPDLLIHVGVFRGARDIRAELAAAQAKAASVKSAWEKKIADSHVREVQQWIAEGFTEVWETADTGQGDRKMQEARNVFRPYDPQTNTSLGVSGRRQIAGWYDIDKAPGATP